MLFSVAVLDVSVVSVGVAIVLLLCCFNLIVAAVVTVDVAAVVAAVLAAVGDVGLMTVALRGA